MNEVKRKATFKYFEQEIWNNLSKQNSFEDRRLNLKCHKLEKDESITVKSWNQEQLLMVRRNKKLHSLIAGSAEHLTQRNSSLNPSRYLSLPALNTAPRPRTTSACNRGTICSGSPEPPRPRSHTDHTSWSTDRLSVKPSVRQDEVSFPAISAPSKTRRSSHSACSQRTSLSDGEIPKQRKTSWTRPSTQLHQRDYIMA